MGIEGAWPDAIEGYVRSLRAQKQSPDTIRLRRWQARWMARSLPVGPWSVSTEDLEELLANDDWSRETLRSRLTGVRGFYGWAHRTGRTATNLAGRLQPVKPARPIPRPCPERVLRDSLAGADRRLRLMLLLGAYGGLRASEIARVHSRDLDDYDWLTVYGKGGKARRVPIVNAEILAAIRDAGGWLFPGRINGHLSSAWVTRLVSAALPEHWTAHTLRHRFGTVANQRTHDLAAVQELLGHASPATTRIYVLVPGEDLIAAVRAAA